MNTKDILEQDKSISQPEKVDEQTQREQQRRNYYKKGDCVRVNCKVCGKEFLQRKPWQLFCGGKCKYIDYWRTHITITREEYEKLKNNQKDTSC